MLDKEVRVWDVYMGLESTVKNLLTSLRAVNELQNSAVRERHWQQLMNTTRVQDYLCSYVKVSHMILFLVNFNQGSHSALYLIFDNLLDLVLFFFNLAFGYFFVACHLRSMPVITGTVQ